MMGIYWNYCYENPGWVISNQTEGDTKKYKGQKRYLHNHILAMCQQNDNPVQYLLASWENNQRSP